MLARLVPREPEAHALVALMEFQASRFAARVRGDGTPVLLADQDRSRWNRAVAVSMTTGPATALEMVDRIASQGLLRGSYLLPSVRGELLARLGRSAEARIEFAAAAPLAVNARERELLEHRAVTA